MPQEPPPPCHCSSGGLVLHVLLTERRYRNGRVHVIKKKDVLWKEDVETAWLALHVVPLETVGVRLRSAEWFCLRLIPSLLVLLSIWSIFVALNQACISQSFVFTAWSQMLLCLLCLGSEPRTGTPRLSLL
jgi:hypothetical protein